jgi:hypothetical protein
VRACALALGAALALSACGGGSERQDEKEPEGEFRVQVVEQSFPSDQEVADDAKMVIAVRNADTKEIPNVAVSLGPKLQDGEEGDSFDRKVKDPENPNNKNPELADPARPVFVLNEAPKDSDTANVDTYALGTLKPGETRRFVWDVSAVEPGPFKITWIVSAGLGGKAKAVLPGPADCGPDGNDPCWVEGKFAGRISDVPPKAIVSPGDGETVVRGREGEAGDN